MKYFIKATIVDKQVNSIEQTLNYDVNLDSTEVTLESVKNELLQWVTVPRGYRLVEERFEVEGRRRDLSFALTDRKKAIFTVYLEEIPKEEKTK